MIFKGSINPNYYRYPSGYKKKPKYGNKPVVVDGVHYHSTGEYLRWHVLQTRLKLGEIKELLRQVEFQFPIDGQLLTKPHYRKQRENKDGTTTYKLVDVPVSYIADFTYYEKEPDGTWAYIVEDFKSAVTRKLGEYRIKLALMRKVHGIAIRESWYVKNQFIIRDYTQETIQEPTKRRR